ILAITRTSARSRPGAERTAVLVKTAGPHGTASRVPAFLRTSLPSRRARGAWRRNEHTKRERQSMPLYEHVYMARQDLSAQQAEEMTATYKGVIEGLGGKLVSDPEYWGVKTLSFRIRKN